MSKSGDVIASQTVRKPRGIKGTRAAQVDTTQRTHVTDLYAAISDPAEHWDEQMMRNEDWGGRRGDR